MEAKQNKWSIMFVVAAIFVLNSSYYKVQGKPQVPWYFIFGDSLKGTSKKLEPQKYLQKQRNERKKEQTLGTLTARETKGMKKLLDRGRSLGFPRSSTGRFSNGKTVVDTITEHLGFDDYIQSYANASNRDILSGVNYASAAAGIRDETGQQLGARTSFGGQVNNYVTTVSQVVRILGNVNVAANHLKKCIYSVGVGSNDYLNNYFMPDYYQTSRRFTPNQYANALIKHYAKQIRVLPYLR
ncbi:GDSL esterase/lipase-like protein [Tanacetum coccineum]